jgi:hypothetical protein
LTINILPFENGQILMKILIRGWVFGKRDYFPYRGLISILWDEGIPEDRGYYGGRGDLEKVGNGGVNPLYT